MKPDLFISRCLLGESVRYNSSSVPLNKENLRKVMISFNLIPICPEVLGGLSIPREPSEIRKERVCSFSGEDLTNVFVRGAEACFKGLERSPQLALLKENSPSCGSHMIYDGSFTGKKIPGEGITAALFRSRGISVYSESELEELFSCCSTSQLS